MGVTDRHYIKARTFVYPWRSGRRGKHDEGAQMSDYAVKKIDEMEAVYLGAFKRARAELGVESFGLQVIDMPPNFPDYPEHDHAEDGQEEVFMALRGGGEIEIEGERFPLDPDHMVRALRGTGDQPARGTRPDAELGSNPSQSRTGSRG
jgi:mannose-6-phosphate isomerase-like protein (cupin superfamily)